MLVHGEKEVGIWLEIWNTDVKVLSYDTPTYWRIKNEAGYIRGKGGVCDNILNDPLI